MTLKILGPNDPALAALQESIAAHPEVDAKIDIIDWENYRAALDECLAAPHANYQAVCIPGHIWLPQLAADGLIAPLDPLIHQQPPQTLAAYDSNDIFESVAAECKFQNNRYVLPLFTDGHIVFYRSDLISLPKSVRPSEWHLYLQGLNLPAGMSPLALKAHPSEILLDWLPYLWDFGGAVVDENGKPAFASQAAIKALEYYKSLRRFAPAETQEYGNGEILSALNEGKTAAAVSWGGQAAAIFDPTKNPHAAQMKTAAFQGAWNATWGVCLPANQTENELNTALNALLPMMGADCDQRVTRIAGSPVRKGSYSAGEKSKYAWLASQEKLLAECRTLPADPAFGARLGGMYAAVHRAFTDKQPTEEALTEAAR